MLSAHAIARDSAPVHDGPQREPVGWLMWLAVVVVAPMLAAPGTAQSSVRCWGDTVFDSEWNDATDFVEVAAGGQHTVARRSDGSADAWGDNQSGQCTVPALPSGLSYAEVTAGTRHTVARRSDG